MLALARKRAAGTFDDLNAETVAHIIATERHHMLHEDEERRFDGTDEAIFDEVGDQLDEIEGALAKRWLPWVCAYTGARVGEIAQLRKQDVAHEHGRWVLVITPEARPLKAVGFGKCPSIRT